MSAPAEWLAALHARARQPPASPRVPLWWHDGVIGSVEPDFFGTALRANEMGGAGWVQAVTRQEIDGWQVNGAGLTATLHAIANALRERGFVHAWRDEQLAVTDSQHRMLGTVERGVVRQLGITTFAVHLVGRAPDGATWVQQRSLTKANDPGLWDTLMGGMVPAADTLMEALVRETWEEAGLRLAQLQDVTYGGRIPTHRPAGEGRFGYVVEYVDWYRCTVPAGVAPSNQDGEVAQFERLAPDELRARLLREHFTTEAALILEAAGAFEG